MMGGRIWVESEAGQGSTFHFTARFGLSGAGAPPPPPAQPAHLHGLPVLVVDDNATNRRILEEVLTNWRMRPRAVDGGEAALAALSEAAAAAGEPFALVLLDGHMPEMDGFTLGRPHSPTPALAGATVLMLTSAGQPEDVARCRELGIRAYLTKPVQQSELLETILAHAGRFAAAHAACARRRSHRDRPRGRLHVLLAEDNSVNQQLARRLLEKQGHTVVIANNGREAVAALERQSFDLVLMDVQMPEMDGFEATAEIRRREQETGAAHADHRHDGSRHEGRPRALPGGRHGRLRLQADPDARVVPRHRGLGSVDGRRRAVERPVSRHPATASLSTGRSVGARGRRPRSC